MALILERAARAQPVGGTTRAVRLAQVGSLVLGVALVVATGLRFWRLDNQPILFFDSGLYLNEARFIASFLERSISALLYAGSDQVANPLERAVHAAAVGTEAHAPELGKPGHIFLLAVAMLLFGKTTFAALLVSATAGVLTVALTYLAGSLGWGRRVGALAAFILAVSAQHVFYSREVLVEATGMLFALAAAVVYLRSIHARERSLRHFAVVGALFGVAFLCNNRISYAPALLVATELALVGGLRGQVRVLARRGVALMVGLVTPLLTTEALFFGVRRIGRFFGATTPWMDYFEQLQAFGRMNAPRLRWDEWPTFWVDLALMDGLPVVTLLLVGMGVAARRRSPADWLLLSSLLVPIALFSVYSTGEVRMRHFSAALPWVAVAAALGVEWLAVRFTRGARGRSWSAPAVAGVLACAVAAGSLPRATQLATPANAWPHLVQYVEDHGIERIAGTTGPVLGYLLGQERTNARFVEAFVSDSHSVKSLACSGYPYLVVDMQAAVISPAVLDTVSRTAPLLTLPHGNDAWYLASLLEHHGVSIEDWGRTPRSFWDAHRAEASVLRLYDFPTLLHNLRPQVCPGSR